MVNSKTVVNPKKMDAMGVGDSTAITEGLRSLMTAQSFSSFRALAQAAGVSEGQLLQFRRGNAAKMRLEMLQRIAIALKIELPALLTLGGVQLADPPVAQSLPVAQSSTSELPVQPAASETVSPDATHAGDAALRAEYHRLQQRLQQQESELRHQFQQEGLYTLEAWLKNWPRVVHAVQTHKPDLLAAKVLPLVKPLEQLLQVWGVETIGCIGNSIQYDPQWHQLTQGLAQPGESVSVVRPGYRQGDRLLHRAEVKGS